MKRVLVGCARVAREAARRAWNKHLVLKVSTIYMQLAGLFLIGSAGYQVYHPLGWLIWGLQLVWLGNGLEPEATPAPEPAEPGDA